MFDRKLLKITSERRPQFSCKSEHGFELGQKFVRQKKIGDDLKNRTLNQRGSKGIKI